MHNFIVGDKYLLCKPFKESLCGHIINNPEFKSEEKINNLIKQLNPKKQYIIRSNSPNNIENINFGQFESYVSFPDKELFFKKIIKESKKTRTKNCLPQFLIQEYLIFDTSGVATTLFKTEIDKHYIEYGKNMEVTSGKNHQSILYESSKRPPKNLILVDKLLKKVKNYYKSDVIIEWGIKNKKIYLLQVRIVKENNKNPIEQYIILSKKKEKRLTDKNVIMGENKNYPYLLDIDLVRYGSRNKYIMKKNGFFYSSNETQTKFNYNDLIKKFIFLHEKINIKTQFFPHLLKEEINKIREIYDIKHSIRVSNNTKYIDELYHYSTTLYFMSENRITEDTSKILSPSNNHYSISAPRIHEHVWPEEVINREVFDKFYFSNILTNKKSTILKELDFLEIKTISNIRRILLNNPYDLSFNNSLSLSVYEIFNDIIPGKNSLNNREEYLKNMFTNNSKLSNKTYYVIGNIEGTVINLNELDDKNIPIFLKEDTVLIGDNIPPDIITNYDNISGIITTNKTGELSHAVLNAKLKNIPLMISNDYLNIKSGNYINIKYA